MNQMTLPLSETNYIDNTPPVNKWDAKFREFHKANPEVYEVIKDYVQGGDACRFLELLDETDFQSRPLAPLVQGSATTHTMRTTHGCSQKTTQSSRDFSHYVQ